MGVQNSGRHKRTATGGHRAFHSKKRQHALARPPSHTKIGAQRVKSLRTRGGNTKLRALRLASGSFELRSHKTAVESKIQVVMYHPSSTELFRTNTLTKGCVVKLDACAVKSKIDWQSLKQVDSKFVEQLERNNCYAVVETRPGQVGRADGRILQGAELEFYMDRFKKGKTK